MSGTQVPINQRFGSLDEYLAFLKSRNAPIDKAWYKEVRPGVFELQTGGNLHLDDSVPAAKRVFTREELERKFGFRK